MLFRQLFDSDSSTYTYLLADPGSSEALLIDPVLEAVPGYLELMDQLDLRLISAVDTHVHADHITGLGELREATECATVMGEHSRAECVSLKLGEGDRLRVGEISLDVL